MKSLIIASATALVVFSSCSVYREGQTPDDIYYSPGRTSQSSAYVEAKGDRDDGRRYDDRPTYNGYDDYATPDDRWLMMRVRNRYRWSYFDDYNYYSPYSNFGYNGWGGYGSYGFGYQPGFSIGIGLGGYYDPFGYSYNRFNDYYYWNSYYNPYYPKMIVVNPKNDPAGYNRIRNFNLSSYNNRAYNNNRSANGNLNNRGMQGYNNTNNNRSLGNSFRRMFSNSNNSTVAPRGNETYRPAQTRPVREYSPSNSNYNNSSSNSTYSPRSSSTNSGGSSGSSGGGSSSGSRPNRR
jgi:uncharacterized membrane protein YgcG